MLNKNFFESTLVQPARLKRYKLKFPCKLIKNKLHFKIILSLFMFFAKYSIKHKKFF